MMMGFRGITCPGVASGVTATGIVQSCNPITGLPACNTNADYLDVTINSVAGQVLPACNSQQGFATYAQAFTTQQGWVPVVQSGSSWVPAPTASAAQIAGFNAQFGAPSTPIASTPTVTPPPASTFNPVAAYQQTLAQAMQPSGTSTTNAGSSSNSALSDAISDIFGENGVYDTGSDGTVAVGSAAGGTSDSTWLILAVAAVGAWLFWGK